MRARSLRAVGVVLVLWLFEGTVGAFAGITLAIAYEVAGVPLGAIWGASVVAIAAAPMAMVAQTAALRIPIGAGFATSNILARVLVGLALACALYAAVAELSAERRAEPTLALTPWERLTLVIRRRRARPQGPAARSDPRAPPPPAG
jgi:hypothetical protein